MTLYRTSVQRTLFHFNFAKYPITQCIECNFALASVKKIHRTKTHRPDLPVLTRAAQQHVFEMMQSTLLTQSVQKRLTGVGGVLQTELQKRP
jgi:hypothetical protein